MRRLTLLAWLACGLPISSCATQTQRLPAAPRIELPAAATKSCELYRLPPSATQSDLEVGYATRGAQVVACNAARALAVETHQAEHALEDQFTSKRRQALK